MIGQQGLILLDVTDPSDTWRRHMVENGWSTITVPSTVFLVFGSIFVAAAAILSMPIGHNTVTGYSLQPTDWSKVCPQAVETYAKAPPICR